MHAAGAGPAYKDTKSVRKKPDHPGIFHCADLYTGDIPPAGPGRRKKDDSPFWGIVHFRGPQN